MLVCLGNIDKRREERGDPGGTAEHLENYIVNEKKRAKSLAKVKEEPRKKQS